MSENRPEAPELGPQISAYIINPQRTAIGEPDPAARWHHFPTTKDELAETLKAIGVDESNNEFFISDFNTGDNWEKYLPEGANLNEINYLAVILADLNEAQREVFNAVVESDRHCGSVKDIINITENLDCFDIQPAYNAEQYGAFHVNLARDDYTDMMNRLEASDDSSEQDFFQYIAGIEAHVDLEAYGKWQAENEGGVFTEQGYLTENGKFQEVYHGPEDIPAGYRVFAYPETEPFLKLEDADLTAVLCKLHALGGDYMADSRYNLNALVTGAADYLLLMNGRNIFLTETAFAYHRGGTAFDMWINADESPGTRAFMLHATHRYENGGVYGDLVEIGIRERQLDILENGIHFTRVDTVPKLGPDQSFTPEEWSKLELIDRDRLQNWTRLYDSADIQALDTYLTRLRLEQTEAAKDTTTIEFLVSLNSEYMAQAENPQPDMLRVTLPAAKDMLARGDAAVYRLMPDGPKQLSPLEAVKGAGGLWYQHYREFAVKRADMDGLDKWAKRETYTLIRRQPERAPDKSCSPEL